MNNCTDEYTPYFGDDYTLVCDLPEGHDGPHVHVDEPSEFNNRIWMRIEWEGR